MLHAFVVLFTGVWSTTTPVRELGHLFSVAFEANLVYTLIIEFGRDGDAQINAWTEKELLRVIPALSETELFDADKFRKNIEQVRDTYRPRIAALHFLCMRWSIVSAVLAVLLLVAAPYHEQYLVAVEHVPGIVIVLFGAIPIGFFGALLLRMIARDEMRNHSKVHDAVIELMQKTPTERVEKARAALRKRLDEEKRVAAS